MDRGALFRAFLAVYSRSNQPLIAPQIPLRGHSTHTLESTGRRALLQCGLCSGSDYHCFGREDSNTDFLKEL